MRNTWSTVAVLAAMLFAAAPASAWEPGQENFSLFGMPAAPAPQSFMNSRYCMTPAPCERVVWDDEGSAVVVTPGGWAACIQYRFSSGCTTMQQAVRGRLVTGGALPAGAGPFGYYVAQLVPDTIKFAVIGDRKVYPKHNVVFAKTTLDVFRAYTSLATTARGKRAFGYKHR